MTTVYLRPIAALACVLGLACGAVSRADDMASFATGGYALSMRNEKLLAKMDTDGDHMMSKTEWLAFQEKVFALLDRKQAGKLDAKAFVDKSGGDVVSIATGGYARALRTRDMMHMIDTDSDGTISHEEYIAYQSKFFDMLDVSTAHHGKVGKEEVMLATGGFSAAK